MTSVSAAAANGAPQPPTSIGKLNADFDMFLKLLTTQMQNQDPLDPMDTSEYTQQLVQYSQVEQAIEQTQTLQAILTSMSTQDLSQASALIGRDVEYDSATAGLSDSAPAEWRWSAGRDVVALSASVVDAQGKVVATQMLSADASSGSFAWNGTRSTGGTAPAGSYTLELTGVDANGNEVPVKIHGVGRVSEVRSDDGAMTLGINGVQIPASSLVRISETGA